MLSTSQVHVYSPANNGTVSVSVLLWLLEPTSPSSDTLKVVLNPLEPVITTFAIAQWLWLLFVAINFKVLPFCVYMSITPPVPSTVGGFPLFQSIILIPVFPVILSLHLIALPTLDVVSIFETYTLFPLKLPSIIEE